jgi:hypothetical protein
MGHLFPGFDWNGSNQYVDTVSWQAHNAQHIPPTYNIHDFQILKF